MSPSFSYIEDVEESDAARDVDYDSVIDLAAGMARLTEKQRTCLQLEAMGYSQAEIGEMLSVSQQRVSQLISEAIAKLRVFLR